MTDRQTGPHAGPEHSSDPQVEAAIDWMVAMRSGEMTEQEFRQFETWRLAEPANAVAWARLTSALQPFDLAARDRAARVALASGLKRARVDRRSVVAGLAGMLAVGVGGLTAINRFVPLNYTFSDYYTMTGEKHSVILDDGSGLVLAPRTAVDLDYRIDHRGIKLFEGQIQATVVPSGDRTFSVEADRFRLDARSGVFVVEARAAIASVVVVAGTATLRDRIGRQIAAGAGDRVVIERDQFIRQNADLETATAWLDGLFIAKDMSVSEIVDALRPYFPGFIRVDPNISEMLASGVFRLTNANVALDSLADALNLSIRRISSYLVFVGPQDMRQA